MATKLYISTATAPDYLPATIRGAWDQTASAVARGLSTALNGNPMTTIAVAETNVNADWDVLLLRCVSPPLAANATIDGTLTAILGVRESNAAADFFTHLHAYVTQGDSDTPRGTLLTDDIGDTEWPTTATGRTSGALALASVGALAGDRIVIEIGYRAKNTATTSYTGTVNYGNPWGASDLTNGSTAVTTLAGTLTISNDVTFTEPARRVTAAYAEVDLTDTTPPRRVTAAYAEVDIAIGVPYVDDLTPDTGEVGDTVTIDGGNFGAAQGTGGVTFNGVAAAVTSWSNTQIVVTVPVGATTGPVVVTTDDGDSSTGVTFTVTEPPVPPVPGVAGGIPSTIPPTMRGPLGPGAIIGRPPVIG